MTPEEKTLSGVLFTPGDPDNFFYLSAAGLQKHLTTPKPHSHPLLPQR